MECQNIMGRWVAQDKITHDEYYELKAAILRDIEHALWSKEFWGNLREKKNGND